MQSKLAGNELMVGIVGGAMVAQLVFVWLRKQKARASSGQAAPGGYGLLYRLSRLMLMAAVVVYGYCLVLFAAMSLVMIGGWAWIVLLVIAAAAAKNRKGRLVLTSCGTAAWAGVADLARAQMVRAKRGLILGRLADDTRFPVGRGIRALFNGRLWAGDACRAFFDAIHRRKRKRGALVRLPQACHTMVVAPTRVGKGVSCILPFLMSCDESCVVIDPKGENALLTARYRRAMGHRVVLLDPFRMITSNPDTFNPFDFIDPASPQALDDCRDIAEALILRTGEEKDPHWCDSAEDVIGGIAAIVVQYGRKDNNTRSLQAAADILSHPQKWDMAKKLMQQHGDLLGRWGGRLEHFRGDELASVFSTSNRFLRFLNTPALVESTNSSSFNPAALKRGRGKMDIFLVLPPERMRAQSALLRLWIGSLFRAVVQAGLGEERKVHFLLDEAAALGHMQQLDDAVDKYAGYGVRLQFYYQSLGQLKKCWPSDQGQTLLSNTTKIFFGTNDIQTAEFVSKSLGNETVLVEGWGSNGGWSRNRGTSSGSNSNSESSGSSYSGGRSNDYKQQRRELLTPDEVVALDPRIAITLTPGLRPIWTRLIRYYEEPELFRRQGGWGRLAAALRTLIVSAALLTVGLAGAAMLTAILPTFIEQHWPRALPTFPAPAPAPPGRPQPGPPPRKAPAPSQPARPLLPADPEPNPLGRDGRV